MDKFIVRVTFYLTKTNLYFIEYYEVSKINEKDLIQTFKTDFKIENSTIKILSFQKMTYKELFQFNLNNYKKLFPDDVKVFTFKSSNEKYFDIHKQIKNNQHELNYIRYMEDKGNKHIGTINKIYDHKLNE